MNKQTLVSRDTPHTYKNYLLSKGFSTATSESYNKNLLQYIVWTESNQIEAEQSTYNEVISYVQHLKNKGTCGEQSRTIKQRTIQLHINSLKHYFNWVTKRQLRNNNPTLNINIKGIKRRKLYNIIGKPTLEKIYHDYDIEHLKKDEDPNIAKRNKIILGLIIYQGLGTLELNRLEVGDVKLREGNIYIKQSRRSNQRTLKLEAHQVLDVMEYTLQVRQAILAENPKETKQLLLTKGSSDHLQNAIQKLLEKLKKKHKEIENLKQIRASVITGWLKVYNLREVQYMAGHRYVSSTESYLINDLEDLKEDINKYHPMG